MSRFSEEEREVFNRLIEIDREMRASPMKFADNSPKRRLELLKIASNCSIPGESSSRTIERAIDFKKFVDGV